MSLARTLLAVGALCALPGAQAQTTVAGFTPGSFRVTESGAAEYRIPIRVPPGIAGMEPKLALVYNSQVGNGLLGVGWSLEGTSAITRCPRTVAQDGVRGGVNYDWNDRYCLEGQRLVAISGSYGAAGTEYRTERESFSRAISYGTAGNGPAWFKVWTKSGQILEYGNTADSRIEAQGKPTVRVWAVNKISDTNGNYLAASYLEDATFGDFYPARIDFGGNAQQGTVASYSVRFGTESRPDKAPRYVAGSISSTIYRISSISTHSGDTPTREYRLSYQQNSTTQLSRISFVTECLGNGSECFPDTTFSWQEKNNGAFFQPNAFNPGFAQISHSNRTMGSHLADFNGDGKTDVLRWADNPQYNALFLSNGNGSFNQPSAFNPWMSQLGHSNGTMGVLLGDFNGDGKTDLLRWWDDPQYNGLLLSNGDGSFTQPSAFNPWFAQIAHSNRTQGAYLGDFNGDGRTDILRWADNPQYNALFISNGDGTFTQPSAFNPWMSQLGHSNGTMGVLLGDFNGDGKTDLLRWWDDWNYNALFLSNGDGSFTYAGAFNPTFSQLGHSNGTMGVLIGDFNADGKSDILRWWNDWNYNALFLSNGDGSFTQPGAFNPAFSQLGHSNHTMGVLLGDFNGDGRTDLLRWWNDPSYNALFISGGDGSFVSAPGFSPGFQLLGHENGTMGSYLGDFNGDGKADILRWWDNPAYNGLFQTETGISDLLTTATDGLGAVTSFTYAPLTDASIYTKDSGALYPALDVQGPLYVVASVSTSNAVGGVFASTHKYTGLRVSFHSGSLGFRVLEMTDNQTGIRSTRTLRQDYPYQGLPTVAESKQSSGVLISRSTNTWDDNPAVNALTYNFATGKYHRVDSASSVEERFELNGSPLPVLTSTTQYDAYGNATTVTVGTGDGYSKTTSNVYVNDTANWLLGRLKSSTVQSTVP